MKVYIVIGCHDYEGGDVWSTRWFTNKEQGDEYGEQLVREKHFDYYEIVEGEEGQRLD